jgi:hypothetical protein
MPPLFQPSFNRTVFVAESPAAFPPRLASRASQVSSVEIPFR